MKFRIKNVDMNGYCGRDRHPSTSDQGLIVTPIGMLESFRYEKDSVSLIGPIDRDSKTVTPEELADVQADEVEQCFVCVVDVDGRVLELMAHELEFWR